MGTGSSREGDLRSTGISRLRPQRSRSRVPGLVAARPLSSCDSHEPLAVAGEVAERTVAAMSLETRRISGSVRDRFQETA